jgi:protein-S-isoprenylcysteine O-methyltransferase Ste14
MAFTIGPLFLGFFQIISILVLLFFTLVEGYYNSKVTHRPKNKETATTLAIILSSFIWVYSFFDASLFNYSTTDKISPFINIVGAIIFIMGIVIRLISFKTLGRFYNYLLTIEEDHKLITFGIYKRIRHPLYLGTILLFFSFPLINGSWGGLLIFILLAPFSIWLRIRTEEKILLNHFGKDYENYKKQTSALWPF